MNILVLEHPRLPSVHRFNDIANTPLWSCLMGGYAASALEAAGFETGFMDHAVPGARFLRTADKVLELNPDLLCINAVYFWEQTPALFTFLDDLRTRGFSGHMTLFGFFPSLVHDRICTGVKAVDSVCVGEFEHILTDLARALAGKAGQASLKDIPGLALKGSCGPVRPRSPEKDLDRFPFPRRASLDRTAAILGSRGCYNHCSFCPIPSFYNRGPLWRGRSPRNIAREMAGLADQGVRDFYFVDPNFIGPGRKGKQRLLELMELIRPLGITFGMETRPQDLDDDILKALVDSGFTSLLMGVESGSGAVLDRIDKQTGPAVASRAIDLCRAHGIEPEIGFLMFVPDSRLPDLRDNLTFLADNRLLDRLDRTANLLSHTQIVLSGTSGFHRFEARDRLRKTGVFGFEAGVTFADPRVAWVADLLTHACHIVLRSGSSPASPIFWKQPDPGVSRAANDYLVALAHDLVDRAGTETDLGEQGKARVRSDIRGRLSVILRYPGGPARHFSLLQPK